jgi:hypothetical protein
MRINKYAVSGQIGPVWAILGHFGPFYVPIWAKAFFRKQESPIWGLHAFCGMPLKQGNALSENKNPRFGDYMRFVACP